MSNTRKIIFPKFHAKQKEVIDDILSNKALYNIVVAGRQFGKTHLAVGLMLHWGINCKSDVMWFSPSTDQCRLPFNIIVQLLDGTGAISKINNSRREITLCNGKKLTFKTTGSKDKLRGNPVAYAILDEFATIPKKTWLEQIQPMLTVKGKKVLIISTPCGRGEFYNMYANGLDEDDTFYKSFKYSSYDNPLANLRIIEDAKRKNPETIFRQEYLAEFNDDDGSVFTKIYTAQLIHKWIEPQPGRKYYAGLDIAQTVDYTVLTIIDDEGKVCYIYRDNKKENMVMVNEIVRLLKKYNVINCHIEANNSGRWMTEFVQKEYKHVTAEWTGKNKQTMIQELMVAFEQGLVKIPTKELFEPLVTELEAFTYTHNPRTGYTQYSAPNGFHDDTVMSLAFAWSCKKIKPKFSGVLV